MALFAAPLLGAMLLMAPQLPIAVLQSGQRVECVTAAIGDRELETPLGVFRCPTDPVVKLVDGTQQRKDFRKLRRLKVIDDATWLQDLSTAGQLLELATACQELLALDAQNVLAYEALERWGHQLDAVPAQLDREQRVAWLWDRAASEDFPQSILAGAQLLDEVSQSSQAVNNRVVSIRELRSALRSKSVVLRRTSAFVAGRQRQFSLRELLLEISISEPLEVVRTAAAAGAHEIHAHSARQYWVQNLARGSDAHRAAAAWNLGHYGGADALQALIHVLAADQHAPGERFRFAERIIEVVSNTDRNALDLGGFNPEQQEVDFRHPSPELELLDWDSTFTVTKYGDSLRAVLLEALDTWANSKSNRDTAAWLEWYLNVWLPARP